MKKTDTSSDQIFPSIGVNDPSVKVKEKRVRWLG